MNKLKIFSTTLTAKEMKITATMTDKKREEVMNLFKNLGLDE